MLHLFDEMFFFTYEHETTTNGGVTLDAIMLLESMS